MNIFYFIEDIQGTLKKNFIVSLVAYFVLLLLPAGSLTASAMAVAGSFLAPDSRICLQEAFQEMNVTKSNTVFDCNTPLDPGGFYGAFSNFEAGDPKRFKYGNSPMYIMTSSAQRDLYLAADDAVYGWGKQFYEDLDVYHDLVCVFPVEKPSSHFIELQNIWYAARSVYRYMKGAMVGYEIRLYRLVME